MSEAQPWLDAPTVDQFARTPSAPAQAQQAATPASADAPWLAAPTVGDFARGRTPPPPSMAEPAPFMPADRPGRPPAMQSPPGAQEFMSAVVKGLAMLGGLPGDLQNLRDQGVDYLFRKGVGAATGREMPSTLPLVRPDQLPGSQDIQAAATAAGGPNVQASSGPGRVAQEAVSGAVALPFGRLAAMLGGVSGAGGEAAGQGAQALGASPEVETVARLGGALAAPAGALGVRRLATPSANSIASQALGSISEAELSKAQELIDTARQLGTPITLAEALGQVVGPNRLQDIQRVVEQSARGGPMMRDFYRERPEQNAAAFGVAADGISPPVASPTEIAPRVQAAAGRAVRDTRQAINREARPYYDAAETQDNLSRIAGVSPALNPSPEMAAAIQAARAGIEGKSLADLPDDAMRVLDAAKKVAEDKAREAARAGRNNEARLWGNAENEIRDRLTSQFPDYEKALEIGSKGRSGKLKPLEREATGQLAEADTFEAQRRVLFPRDPETLNETAVKRAVGEVVKRDPDAARQLVRQYLENTFNKTTREQANVGAREFNAARFRAEVVGNPQQAKNLQAAVLALPGGTVAWRGFDNLLRVFEAQGARMAPGSMTEFNKQIAAEMAGTKLTATPLSRMTQALENFRYGRSSQQLAEMLTSPDAADKLKQLAIANPRSEKAAILALSLLAAPKD